MWWNTYFNALMKRKGKLFGEQWWFCLMVERLVQSVKIFIRIILNFNAFTINLQKQFIECLGKAQGKGKKKALPSPTNHLPSSWTAVPLCPPIIVIWIVQRLLFMSVCSPKPLSCGLENSFYLWVPVNFHIRKISRSIGIFYVQWNFSRLWFSTYRNMHSTIICTMLRS